MYFPLTVATHTMTTLETESTSSSSSSSRDSCTEPLVMTGCIGFIGGLIATLLVCLPTFLFVCRRKPKIKMTRYNTNYRTNMQNLSVIEKTYVFQCIYHACLDWKECALFSIIHTELQNLSALEKTFFNASIMPVWIAMMTQTMQHALCMIV